MTTMDAAHSPIDVLMISEQPLWPLDQGFKVHGLHMAQALQAMGVHVRVMTLQPAPRDAPAPVRQLHMPWPTADDAAIHAWRKATSGRALDTLRHRLARYWVNTPDQLAGAVHAIDAHQPAAIIGVGLHSPVILHALRRCRAVPCIWYGADELVRFHASCLRREAIALWPRRLRHMMQHAAMENLFVRGLDGAIGVSPIDARLMRLVAGARRTITLRNGVDLTHFRPPLTSSGHAAERPNSLVFWGRLDFEPNVDAVIWFADHVWPLIRRSRTTAALRIVGKCPTPRVAALNNVPGITVVGPVADLRGEAWSSQVTILPMRCGGGIKNKLLEAAAMARPIVASPVAVSGLVTGDDAPPWRLCRKPDAWANAVIELWEQPLLRARMGRDARAWVEQHHDWCTAAKSLCDWLQSFTSLGQRASPQSSLSHDNRYRRAA